MKVSEITTNELADYLRLEKDGLEPFEVLQLETLLCVARAFIRSYTGLSDDDIDAHEDFIIVVYILVQDMFDNRVMYVDNDKLNKVVDTILGMHSINYI